MVSLYKRATPSQRRILRVVEGAVLNEADAHGRERDKFMARSIAKRAAGTLTAQWPDVLAAVSLSSDNGGVVPAHCARQRRSDSGKGAARRSSQTSRRSPLSTLWRDIAKTLGQVKRSGEEQRYAALVDVLKMIAALQRRDALDI